MKSKSDLSNTKPRKVPGLTGVKKAAPVMFDIFRLLPETSWFKTPDKLVPIKTCKKSGFLPTTSCKETVTIMAPAMGIHQKSCPFHKIIQLDSTQKFRINSNCYPLHKSCLLYTSPSPRD